MRFLWLCSNTTNIVPRLAEANEHIPAYVDNMPAWGSKPIAVSMRRALLQRIASKPSSCCDICEEETLRQSAMGAPIDGISRRWCVSCRLLLAAWGLRPHQ